MSLLQRTLAAVRRVGTERQHLGTRVISSQADPAHLYTTTKEWCRFVEEPAGSNEHAHVVLGLSLEGLDDFGEPGQVVAAAAEGQELAEGEGLLHIQWQGFTRTSSDELYHAVWKNTTGTRTVTVPFSARVLQYNQQIIQDPGSLLMADKEHENWLVRLEVPKLKLKDLRTQLMSRQDYLGFIDR